MVPLLPKEFRLLAFLCSHPNQAFRREQLLDAVWPGETPVDRTVDDHVYRLRRKLSMAGADASALQTVRGHGYRLALPSVAPNGQVVRGDFARSAQIALDLSFQASLSTDNPLLADPMYRDQVRQMFYQYVLFGHGVGIDILRENPAIFGIQRDTELRLGAWDKCGDMRAILADSDATFTEKSFWLLSYYHHIGNDEAKAWAFWRRAIESYMLPAHHHLEAICFALPDCYLRLGRLDLARQAISDTLATSLAMDYAGYIPLAKLQAVELELHARDFAEAKRKLVIAKEQLTITPWQRELANASILEGLLHAARGDGRAADALLRRGIQLLWDSGIVSHVIIRLRDILFFLTRVLDLPELRRPFSAMWADLSNERDFPGLAKELEHLLDRHLPPLREDSISAERYPGVIVPVSSDIPLTIPK